MLPARQIASPLQDAGLTGSAPGAEALAHAYLDYVCECWCGDNGATQFEKRLATFLDPDLPAQTNAPYTQVIGLSLLPNRAAASAAAAFGLLGIVLASVGLYGVLSYSVSLRTHEIGVRIALGADGRSIRRAVLADALKLVSTGLGIGLPLALSVAILVRSMLYGLSPADPVTFGSIVVLFICVGLLASFVPARRATQTDPIVALRCE